MMNSIICYIAIVNVRSFNSRFTIMSNITCYGSSNIRLSNNKLQYSRIGVLLAVGYSNITIEENDYQLYRLPMPPIFTYYVAEAKSEYQGAEDIMGTFTDITKNDPYYTSDCNIPAVTEKVIDYTKLLTPTGETKEIPNGATSAEIQSIIDGLKMGMQLDLLKTVFIITFPYIPLKTLKLSETMLLYMVWKLQTCPICLLK